MARKKKELSENESKKTILDSDESDIKENLNEKKIDNALLNTKMAQESLSECFNISGVKYLGDELKTSDIWVEAIALVKKNDMSYNYALVVYDYGKPKIVRDFGSLSKIEKIESIYPYSFLNSNYLPSVNSREEMEGCIKSKSVEELKNMSIEDVAITFVGDAVIQYLHDKKYKL